MKRYRGIKYSFRPDNYWYDETVLQAAKEHIELTPSLVASLAGRTE